jgi:hypothetical protein
VTVTAVIMAVTPVTVTVTPVIVTVTTVIMTVTAVIVTVTAVIMTVTAVIMTVTPVIMTVTPVIMTVTAVTVTVTAVMLTGKLTVEDRKRSRIALVHDVVHGFEDGLPVGLREVVAVRAIGGAVLLGGQGPRRGVEPGEAALHL